MPAGVVKPMLLLAACLASLSGRWACHGTNATTSADQNPSVEQTGLEPALGAAGLENPGAAHHTLLELVRPATMAVYGYPPHGDLPQLLPA